MRLGLRPQLLVLVTLLLGLAFVPMFWTATTMSRVSLDRTEQRAAFTLCRSVATSIADGKLSPTLGLPIVGIRLVRSGAAESSIGLSVPEAARASAPLQPYLDRASGRRVIWSWARGKVGDAYVGVAVESESHYARSFIGLLSLYMVLFGVALLLAIHLAITMLIVRPLEALGLAARRVAFGARSLEVPNLPARELVSLGKSLNTMTEKLLSDERELRRHLDEIHLANERLTEAQERLIRSERLASVGRLAAGLAHEVGNPIAAMLGLEELLLSGSLSADEQLDFLRRIHRETDRIHRILRDLLDFARPTGKSGATVDTEPGDIAVAVTETLALIRPQQAFKQVVISNDLPNDLPLVALSRPKLVQVLLNLLLNAADALTGESESRQAFVVRELPTETLGNRITVRTLDGEARIEGDDCAAGGVAANVGSLSDGGAAMRVNRIGIAAFVTLRTVRLTLADNGPGVIDAVRQHLFEPFVTTKEVGKGTGLGLAVCRGLVESSGGNIQLDASYRDGARFVIELPRYFADEGS